MPLGQYEQMEANARKARERQQGIDLECISCPTCNSQWFEEVEVSRYKLDHFVALGQKLPQRPGQQVFILLKCIHCGDHLEPKVSIDLRDRASESYNFLIETLEGKEDTRKDGKFKAQEL